MVFKEKRSSDFKYLIHIKAFSNKYPALRQQNIIILNSKWFYCFKLKVYKNHDIVSNGYWFDVLSLGIK